MKYRFIRLSSLIVLLALVIGSTFSARAQQPSTNAGTKLQHLPASGKSAISGSAANTSVGVAGGPQARAAGKVKVVVQLADEPATAVYVRETAAKSTQAQVTQKVQQQLAKIEQAQLKLVNQLTALKATVLYRNQRVYNGIAIQIDASQVARILTIDGVTNILPLISKTIDNSSSVKLIGAPDAWTGVNGVTGTGLKIGVIDTGIDYTHSNFGGLGTTAAYTSNITTVITDAGFPSAKVVGGWDFVGDDYNAAPGVGYQPIPHPDPDPLDCGGHGSHVSGTTAGFGVNTDGTTYAGPYNNSINFGALRIGPGVAPQAKLYALKVFGCEGSTDVTDEAIEWSVDPDGNGDFSDRLDVINMSLGSAFGSEQDSSAVASNAAAAAGVIVVASAGNSGDTYYISGAPGSAQRVISVASSVDAQSILDGFRVNGGSMAGVQPGLNSVAYAAWTNNSPSLPLTGTLYYPATNRNGCAAFSPAEAANIAGKIVLLDWSEPSCAGSVGRTGRVTAAGGIGILIADDSAVFDLAITGSATAPSQSIPVEVGTALKAALVIAPFTITFDRQYNGAIKYNDNAIIDTLSSFSSRGPRRGDNGFKPDISAPGQSIYSTSVGTGNEGTTLSGTSMAAPHMAGVVALLRQLHPAWTVEEIKALAVNTASYDIRAEPSAISPIYGPTRGPGRVNVPKAATSNVVMYASGAGNAGAVNLSFGAVEVVGTATITKTVSVVNKGGSAVSYNAAYAPITSIPGVSYVVSPAVVSVAANSSATLNVVMTANASQMKKTRDVTVAALQAQPRDWLSEAAGHLTLTATGSATMFSAMINGTNEAPPVSSTVSAMAKIDYNPATNAFSYTIKFTGAITPTMAHLHNAIPGISGGVVIALPVSGGQYNANTPMTGQITLASEADEALLNKGSLYINIHTAAAPSGQLRGQVNSASPTLRLGVYVTARPASTMAINENVLPFKSDVASTTPVTVTLAGTAVNNGIGGNGITSLVSFYDLQYTDDNESASTGTINGADLKYVGITSDFPATANITNTGIYIGLATYGNWSVPSASDVEFDVYFDTNRDGTDDYVMYQYNFAQLTGGRDASDVFVTVLYKLTGGAGVIMDFVNATSSASADTTPYNSNVLMLPVYASDLKLNLQADPTFDYYIVTFSREVNGASVDSTPILTYDPSAPGFDITGGVAGAPIYIDTPGTINFTYDPNGSESMGVLALHHHNTTGTRDELFRFALSNYLPAIRK